MHILFLFKIAIFIHQAMLSQLAQRKFEFLML